MPKETGIWSREEALEHHAFSYRLAKFIGDYLPIDEPIIDWGCGKATYLRYLYDRGFRQLHGVEGEELPFTEFSNVSVQDLTTPITKNPIGNSICLEVGEHIPAHYSDQFIKNLVENTEKKLIISWAIPGQDGIGHVNCRHNIWVIDRFKISGMRLNVEDSLEIRQHVDNNMAYFRDTLLVFEKI